MSSFSLSLSPSAALSLRRPSPPAKSSGNRFPIALRAAIVAVAAAAPVASRAAEVSRLEEIIVSAARVFDDRGFGRPASTGTALDVTAFDLPASLEVLDLGRQTERGARTVAEATRGATGLTFTTRAGAPGVFAARGFTENALVTLYDGVRIQSATITARAFDPFHFERIEILRGPSSLSHGEGASAGAVNYVRRKPRLGDFAGEVLLEGGSFSRRRLAVALSGGLTESIGSSLSVSRQEYKSFVESNDNEITQAVASLGGRLGERAAFVVQADLLRTRIDDAYWGQPVVNGRVDERIRERNYNQSPSNRMDDDVRSLRGVLTWQPTDALSYRGEVSAYDADRDWRNFYAFASLAGPPQQAEVRNVEDLGYEHRMVSTRHDLRVGYSLAGAAAQTAIYVEYSDTDFSSPRRDGAPPAGPSARPRFDLLRPQPVEFITLTSPRLAQREADVEQAGIGLEQRIEIGKRWALTAGVRSIAIDAVLARPQATPAVVPFRVDPDAVDWRAALIFTPSSDHRLYLSGSTGSEPVESLLLLPFTQAQFELAEATGIETGWKGRYLAGALEASAAVYWLEKDQLPSVNPANPNLAPQVGRQTSRGAEASMVYESGQLRASLNAAYSDAEYDQFNDFGAFRNGVRPANVPEWVLNGSIAVPLPRNVVIGGFAQYVGSRPSNNTNLLFLDAYATLDLFAEWRASERVALTARVLNAFDETYVEWATQTFGQNNLYFGSPRRYELAVRVVL